MNFFSYWQWWPNEKWIRKESLTCVIIQWHAKNTCLIAEFRRNLGHVVDEYLFHCFVIFCLHITRHVDISPARQTQTQPGFNIINFSLHGYLNEIDVWVGIHLIIDLQYYLFKRQGLYRKKICLHHRTGQALSNRLILLL